MKNEVQTKLFFTHKRKTPIRVDYGKLKSMINSAKPLFNDVGVITVIPSTDFHGTFFRVSRDTCECAHERASVCVYVCMCVGMYVCVCMRIAVFHLVRLPPGLQNILTCEIIPLLGMLPSRLSCTTVSPEASQYIELQ